MAWMKVTNASSMNSLGTPLGSSRRCRSRPRTSAAQMRLIFSLGTRNSTPARCATCREDVGVGRECQMSVLSLKGWMFREQFLSSRIPQFQVLRKGGEEF